VLVSLDGWRSQLLGPILDACPEHQFISPDLLMKRLRFWVHLACELFASQTSELNQDKNALLGSCGPSEVHAVDAVVLLQLAAR
jgi:hypothetical protein